MDCRVVAISRTLGGHGEQVARRVSDLLGFRYVDDEIITRAAEQAGVSPETIGQVERTPPLMARILTAMAAAPSPEGMISPEMMPLPDYSSQAYRDLITQVIRDTAAAGDVLLVAHGASFPLAGTPGLIRAFVTASPQTRVRRLMEKSGLNERDAARAVESSDQQRREFLRRFYNVREELPVHYDLVVNTDVLAVEEAAAVLARATGR